MTFATFIDFLRKHVLGAVAGSALVGAGLSFASSDLVNYRTATRSAIQSDYDKGVGSQAEVEAVIQKFTAVARGTGTATDADVDALRMALDKTYVSAENLANRLPKLRPDFADLSRQMLALRAAAESLKGPTDGGDDFVHSLSEYYFALRKFNDGVVSAQQTWIALR